MSHGQLSSEPCELRGTLWSLLVTQVIPFKTTPQTRAHLQVVIDWPVGDLHTRVSRLAVCRGL